jgi:hypothetical protein
MAAAASSSASSSSRIFAHPPPSKTPPPINSVMQVFQELPDIDILCLGRVCRIWRAISEVYCDRIQQKKGFLGHRCQTFPTYRALYSYFFALGLHRKKAWEPVTTDHWLSYPLYGYLKRKLCLGSTQVETWSASPFFNQRAPERSPVSFQALGYGTYLLNTALQSRRVLLPVVNGRDASTLGLRLRLIEENFPPQIGEILCTVPGDKPDTFYTLNTSGSVFAVHKRNEGLLSYPSPYPILTHKDASALDCSPEGVLIIGTHGDLNSL